MAAHIQSVELSGIRRVTKEQFYQELQWGDMVFCSGRAEVSEVIEGLTKSPFSHVLMVWLPFARGPWVTIEATIDRGVHVGLLSDYTGGADGSLVLARRKLTDAQKAAQLATMIGLVDDKYDLRQEISTAAHRLLKCFPVVQPKGELFCSGLMDVGAQAVAPYAYTMDAVHPNMPAPEDIYTDASVDAVCALVM